MKRALSACILALWLLSATGCGFIDYFFLPPAEDTAQELFEAGTEAMKEKAYLRAAEAFSKLKDRYPFSPFTPRAEIALGDSYYLAEDYEHAAEAYKEFEGLHPRHELTPYVLFQLGRSYFNLFRSIDMPQSHVSDALEYFGRLSQSFPDSQYTPEAKEYMVRCRRYMAEHEVFVADFYWRSERYSAAWRRYKFISEAFTDLPDVVQYAAKRAEMSYMRAQEDETVKERERVQGSWKKWFDWL